MRSRYPADTIRVKGTRRSCARRRFAAISIRLVLPSYRDEREVAKRQQTPDQRRVSHRATELTHANSHRNRENEPPREVLPECGPVPAWILHLKRVTALLRIGQVGLLPTSRQDTACVGPVATCSSCAPAHEFLRDTDVAVVNGPTLSEVVIRAEPPIQFEWSVLTGFPRGTAPSEESLAVIPGADGNRPLWTRPPAIQ